MQTVDRILRRAPLLACLVAGLTVLSVLCGPVWAQSDISDERRRLIDLQVRLAWAHASPGPIDGLMGKNTELAIEAFQRMQQVEETGEVTDDLRQRLAALRDAETLVDYTITEDDVDGPFIDAVPADMEEMAELDRLSYTSAEELLAEKFQMDRELLRLLNEGKDFSRAGTTIRVANLADLKLEANVARIEVIKSRESVWAYDEANALIASFPATIGSDETPSPEGTHQVAGLAFDPVYTYDPEQLDFEGVEAAETFSIQPGPNNPVGVVWIDLDEPGYGIHGSPEPEKIRRQSSHGCVRLTNWDARQLAESTRQGVEVQFVEEATIAN